MASGIQIPRRLPILLVTDNVLLPGSSMRIPVKNAPNMNMVKSRLLSRNTLSSTIIGVVPRQSETDDLEMGGLHSIGTAAVVVQVTGTNWPQPAYTLLATGLCRFKVDSILQETPYPIARVTQLDKLPGDGTVETVKENTELAEIAETFRDQASKLVEMLDVSIPVVAKLKRMLDSLPSQHLPDICASIVKASYDEKLQVLDAVDLSKRFSTTLPLLVRQIEALKLLQKSQGPNSRALVRSRSQIPRRTLTLKEHADDDQSDNEDIDELKELEQKIKLATMPTEAHKTAIKELNRLKKMPQQMPEHAIIRSYLELMTELPWSKASIDTLDVGDARQILDEDHYGLDKVKKRIIEYLAVRQLKNSLKGPILCFVGPPGVGKTSLGKSIARTLNRQFHRIALGGVCDQSDIRGHRRTYIGSMPGRIIQGLRQVGVKNPVFLLDEVDKLGKSLQGDPSAALLEVLDPEQNHSFVDHYLNTPFDLSQVLFIVTANSLETIPAPLRDRTEMIYLPGYTHEEKHNIAKRHLLPKQYKEHGLSSDHIIIIDDALKVIVGKYTREAGVRSLERQIGAVCRAVAVKVAKHLMTELKSISTTDKPDVKADIQTEIQAETVDVTNVNTIQLPPIFPIVIDENAVEDILGPPMFESEVSERLSQPGVAIGLAWTAMGGEIMYVEATRMAGEGKLVLTGQLGDVMKESANLALNWIRSNANELGLVGQLENHSKMDIHIHFPAGAISKDGPSAGVTITTVLVSLLTGQCVRSDTAMTGEVTLRGLVLPVGGIKEKVLAAHRAGITRILLPKRNQKDLHEVPDNVKRDVSFVFVSKLEDVLEAAFDDGFMLNNNIRINSKL